MVDLSPQMENALKKHFDASGKIEERQKAGKFLYIVAWIVEIFAVLTGLLIALSNPYLAYNELSDPKLIDQVLAFQGILPLIVIAVVEATKIPLAQGFYLSKMLRWKVLFLSALLLLIFVTFETMVNGLETNFSFTTNRIIDEETLISEKTLKVSDLNNQILNLDEEKKQLEELSEKTISDTFQKNIDNDDEARDKKLSPLYRDKDNIENKYTDRISVLENKNLSLLNVGGSNSIISEKQRQLRTLETEKKDLIASVNERYRSESELLSNRLIKQEGFLREAQKEDSIFDSTASEVATAEDTINKINARLSEIRKEKKNEIDTKNLSIDNEIENLRTEITKLSNNLSLSNQSQIKKNESEIEKLRKSLQREINAIDEKIVRINSEYNSNTKVTSELKNKELRTISERKERIPLIEKEKNSLLNEIEVTNQLIRDAKKAKREKIQENNVFRLTAMLMPKKCKNPVIEEDDDGKLNESCPEGIYFERDIANVTKEDTKYVAIVWFGSISFIIAIIGVLLALASFVITDEENFRAQKPKFLFNSFRRLVTSFSLLLKKFATLFVIIGKAITNFFDGLTHIFDKRIRDGIRRSIVGFRKNLREPKIKVVEVPKEVIVEKKIEVPIEKEKIVYTEVPKEVIRREIVHMPIYSTEYGKVDLNATKMSEAATDNFTNIKSESVKTPKNPFEANKTKSKPTSKATPKKR